MNNIKNKLNIVGKCFVKTNSQNGEILSFIPEIPGTFYLDDLLFILTIPDECEEQEEDYEGGVENWITYEAKELTSNNIMDFIEDESIGSDEEVWIRGMIIEYNV